MQQPQTLSQLLTTSIGNATNKCSSALPKPSANSERALTSPQERQQLATLFIEKYRPHLQSKLLALPHQAFTAKAPTLGQIARKTSPDVATQWVVIQLNAAAKLWGGKDNISHATLETVATAVLAIHHGLTPPEIMLYIAQLLSGRYGKIAYGQLTPDDLLAHLPAFYEQQSRTLAAHYKAEEEREREAMFEHAARYAVTREQYLETCRRAEMGDLEAQALLRGPAGWQASM